MTELTQQIKLSETTRKLPLSQCGPADASNNSAEKSAAKAVTLSGKISDDGKTLVSDKDNKSWTISNPDAVKGHEGHEVKVKAHEDAAKNEIHIVSLKMKSASNETMKK